MTRTKPPTSPATLPKRHIARLQRMLRNLDAEELAYQETYGDLVKGSIRASLLLDAEALRAVLALLVAPNV